MSDVALDLQPRDRELYTLVSCLCGFSEPHAARPLLITARGRTALTAEGSAAIVELLRRGVVKQLLARGGHRLSRAHGGGVGTRARRMTDLADPPALPITHASWALLAWMLDTAVSPAVGFPSGVFSERYPLSLGDEVVFYLAADLLLRLGGSHFTPPLGELQDLTAPSALLFRSRLACAIYGVPYVAPAGKPSLVSTREGRVVLSLLQPDLATHAVSLELARRRAHRGTPTDSWGLRVRNGPLSLATEVIAAKHPELATFAVEAFATLLRQPDGSVPATWFVAPPTNASLAERQRRARDASALASFVRDLEPVLARARATGMFDDDYDAARALVEILDPYRPTMVAAADLARGLASLQILDPSQPRSPT
ncbi:MAG: hypothetical protein U0271_20400 [Polyangiaceae bacterium]